MKKGREIESTTADGRTEMYERRLNCFLSVCY